MKHFLFFILVVLSLPAFTQVESVELFPDIINPVSEVRNSSPSLDEAQTRVSYLQREKSEKETKIMVSDKASNGLWSQPYAAHTFKKSDNVQGISMTSTGSQIYFDMNDDIWSIEYLGGTSWSKPHRIGAPISIPGSLEMMPSISGDNQVLSFIRNVRVRFLLTGEEHWRLTPFIVKRTGSNSWGIPQKVIIPGFQSNEEISAFHYNNTQKKVFFSITSSRMEYSNNLATLKDSVCIDVKKIDFTGGFINWVSNDFKTGLITTNTRPLKIGMIKFDNSFADEGLLSRDESVTIRNPVVPVQNAEQPIRPIGKYYALLIGVSHYNDSKLNLDKPVKDVEQLKTALCTRYEFNSENVNILTDPSRQEIISELYKLRSKIAPEDNLLIFFAGHGFWDEGVKQGYWWPKDARKDDPSFWLSNSDLREQIRGINSRHTLLISDACFSGGIFKTRGVDDIRSASVEIQILYKTKSRRAITSGNLSTVPDQSVFFEYLLKRLQENEEKFISSQLLFSSLKLAVINNSLTIPQEGVINDAGDEGGDFIFIRKEN